MHTRGMSGKSYFEGQEPGFCGCYPPDVTQLSLDIEKNRLNCFCIRHGKFSFKPEKNTKLEEDVQKIPSEEFFTNINRKFFVAMIAPVGITLFGLIFDIKDLIIGGLIFTGLIIFARILNSRY